MVAPRLLPGLGRTVVTVTVLAVDRQNRALQLSLRRALQTPGKPALDDVNSNNNGGGKQGLQVGFRPGQLVVGRVRAGARLGGLQVGPPSVVVEVGRRHHVGRVCVTQLADREDWKDLATRNKGKGKNKKNNNNGGSSFGFADGDFVQCVVLPPLQKGKGRGRGKR